MLSKLMQSELDDCHEQRVRDLASVRQLESGYARNHDGRKDITGNRIRELKELITTADHLIEAYVIYADGDKDAFDRLQS